MKKTVVVSCGLWAMMLATQGKADQFHYNNIIIGDRALGLGGAYTAISDDSSGIFYNPAGLAYALSNDISGSANALYWRKTVYKNALGGQDFVERSQGSVPSFFGGLQKLDHIAKGLVFGFGMYSTDNEQKDQDDLYTDFSYGGSQIHRFHRTVQLRAASNYFGGGVGYRISSNFAIGFGLKYIMIDELTQEYQDIEQNQQMCTAVDADNKCTASTTVAKNYSQNIRQSLSASGFQPVLGFQYAVDRIALGLTIKKGLLTSDDFEMASEGRSTLTTLDATTGKPTTTPASYSKSISPYTSAEQKKYKVLGELPTSARLGIAWFASPRFLWTTDVMYYGAVKSSDDSVYARLYDRESVINIASGAEFYTTPNLPIRFAWFQNNDSRPEVKSDKSGQLDHIDYNGFSLFLGWVQPNSQVSVGSIYQVGDGKAQKLGGGDANNDGKPDIEKVEATSFTVAFSATHNF